MLANWHNTSINCRLVTRLHRDQEDGNLEVSVNQDFNYYQPCCVKARGLFCWLETSLGLMWAGGICSADSAHRDRFPGLVSGYTNPGQAWAFTIGRGVAELVGPLIGSSAWDMREADRFLG